MGSFATSTRQSVWRTGVRWLGGGLLAALLTACGSLQPGGSPPEAVQAGAPPPLLPAVKAPVPAMPPMASLPAQPAPAPVPPPPASAAPPAAVVPVPPPAPVPAVTAPAVRLRATAAPSRPSPQPAPPVAPAQPAVPTAGPSVVAEVHYVPVAVREKEELSVELWLSARLAPEALSRKFTDKYQQAAQRSRARALKAGGSEAGAAGQFDPSLVATHRYEAIQGDVLVQLVGLNGLEVSPKEAVRQSLATQEVAQWSWKVTAAAAPKEGKASLNFLIFTEVGGQRQQIDSFTEEVTLEAAPVSLYDRAYKLMEELNKWLALLGIGGVGGLYALYQKFKPGGTEQA